jgi:hypothetical protein
MAFSDARNERDRAETGKNSSTHGGGDAKAAERRNVNAMAANNRPTNRPVDTRFQPRRTQNITPSYEMSLHNMMELSKMMPGPGMGLRGLGGAFGLGVGPDFQGFTGNRYGPGDYDPANRFGVGNNQSPMQQQGIQGIQAAGLPKPPTPPMQGMSPFTMQGGQMSVPGPSQYGVNLPSYGYFGSPGMPKPKSAIMGGI